MRKCKFYLVAILAVVVLASCSKVKVGEVGIKVDRYGSSKGVNEELLSPGHYWIGWNTDLYTFPTYQVNYTFTAALTEGNPINEEFTFQTKEGMVCSMDIGLSLHFDQAKIIAMFQKYHQGVTEIKDIVVRNQIRDAVNKVAGTMPIESVYGEGKKFLIDSIQKLVKSHLEPNGIVIDNLFLIGNVRIPPAVEASLNDKVKATQEALKIENEVAKAKAEADKVVATAKGTYEAKLLEAKGNIELSKSITPELIQYRAQQTWDGKMPTYWGGGALPFINIK